jgi:hypothetical protein
MDEADARARAQAHAKAVVAGDLRAAGGDLDKAARSEAPHVMERLPRPLERASVRSVEAGGGSYTVHIRYEGGGREVTVRTSWAERDGRPKIVDMGVV